LVVVVIVKIEFISKANAINFAHAKAADRREPNTIRSTPTANTGTVVFPAYLLGIALHFIVSTVRLSSLETCNFFENKFQSTFGNMKLALEPSTFFVPTILFPCPLIVDPLRILFLGSNFLLRRFKPLFRLRSRIDSFIPLPC
jgi:hypothetical protein